MNKFRLFLSICMILCMAATVQAQGSGKFEFGTEISSFNYEEPNFMEEEGVFWGFFGNYTYRSQENQQVSEWNEVFGPLSTINMFAIDARFMIGEVDYTSNGTGSLDGIEDYLFEIRGLMGYDIPVFEVSRITPFFGLAYRYLNDDSGGLRTTTGAAGYERESNYIYIPVGIEFFTPFDNGWSFTASVEYDFFVDGKQKSHLGDAVAGLNTVENDQKKGMGVRGSIKIKCESESFDFFVEPYVRYWDVDDSEISPITFSGVLVGFGLEPENNSLEAGARIGISF